MYGATHAKEFLPDFIGPESRKLKTMLQLRASDPYFYGEDHAPGHYHDNCSVTKETGLNAIRKDFFLVTNGHRKRNGAYPSNGEFIWSAFAFNKKGTKKQRARLLFLLCLSLQISPAPVLMAMRVCPSSQPAARL